MKYILFTAFIIFLMISCQIEENPNLNTEGNLLVKLDTESLRTGETGWVMVHSIDGDLLAFGRVNNNSQNYFDTKGENKIHITLAKTRSQGRLDLESITDVSADKTYTLGLKHNRIGNNEVFSSNTPIEITVNHEKSISNLILSHFSSDYSQAINPTLTETTSLTSQLRSASNQTFLAPALITARSIDNELRFFEPDPSVVMVNKEFSIEFNQMIPFDKTYLLPVDGMDYFYYEVWGLGVDDTNHPAPFFFFKSRLFDKGNQALLKSGESQLPIGAAFYNPVLFNFWGKHDNGNYFFYQTIGTFPENLQLPKNETVDISSSFPQSLNFNSSFGFNRFESVWIDNDIENGNHLTWKLHGENPGIRILEMPENLVKNFPILGKTGELHLNNLLLTKSTLKYEEFINNSFIQYNNPIREEITVQFLSPDFN